MMVDDQARTALRDAVTGVLYDWGETIDDAALVADAVLAVLPDHAPALLAMLGNVREGVMFADPSNRRTGLDDWEVLPMAPTYAGPGRVFVVALHPAGETP